MAHLLKYDSVHGRFNGTVEASDTGIVVNGTAIPIYAIRDPKQLPWADLNVDVAIEATGIFAADRSDRGGYMDHIDAGAKKVILTVPAKNDITTVVLGVNNDVISADVQAYSNASCTTNCLAPLAKVLDDAFGIKRGYMTTVHAFTNDQNILDLPHKDLRRARAAQISMIPTTTGAAKALGIVLPDLAGKIDGMAIRVPTPCVSLVDMVVNLEKDVSAEELNEMFQKASENHLKGVLGYCDEPLVSVDYVGTRCSSIIDALSTKVIDGKTAKILVWYDNEWGFTNRAVDLLGMLAKAC